MSYIYKSLYNMYTYSFKIVGSMILCLNSNLQEITELILI